MKTLKKFLKKNRIALVASLLMFSLCGITALSAINPDTASEIVTAVTIAGIVPVGMIKNMVKTKGPGKLYKEDGDEGGGGSEKELLEKIKKNVDTQTVELKSKIEGLEKKGLEYDKLQEKFTALEEKGTDLKEIEEFKKLSKDFDDLAVEMKSLKENPPTPIQQGAKNIGQALALAFEEKTVKEQIEAIVKTGKQTAPVFIEVKAVDVISVASTIGAGATQVTITEDTGVISPIRKRELQYMANVSVGNIGSNRAVWVEETDEEGVPIMLGEGDTKTQLDVQYVEKTTAVKKIAVFGKVTTELMADIPQLISFIQNNLMKRMDIVLEDQLFSGNGAGDNLLGSIGQAAAFTGGTLADTVSAANEYDVIVAIGLQAEEAFGIPNAVFVHPGIQAKLRLLKATTGEYLVPRGTDPLMMVIAGMRIISTTAVGADVFLGGDLNVIRVLQRSEMSLQIGLDGNDFTQNKKTMLMEKRLAQYISANDTSVIITGNFTAAKVALDPLLP